ncbi:MULTISPECIES: RidA family protein [Providencia]|uniref:RidA family protein n=5 Tax=Providencia stuartii TaxID=588 RepID=A0AAJ1N3G9_PROST|nr:MULTISPECIES: RidA family protein [Providencia]SST03404.1 YjgF family translation initiation inhibitor [Acinetobacter baumannii]HBM4710608.1 RidA family protein [Escherichia coli]AFH92964.1 endoribonuclease L-PSP family protein [Providencia stuartii MRSN 2154]AIN64018.1 endoribonuclease L-PSP family protein [Providencia stuartii]AMG68592.1 RidA family protein [Providencia stuartii]
MSKKSINPSSVFNSLQYGFSQAIETTGTRQLFLSGQVGVDANQQTVAGGIYEQTIQAIKNIEYVLKEAHGTLNDVVMLRIYIKQGCDSDEEQNAISQALKEKFTSAPPASSWVIVTGLSLPEWLIEIEAHAVLN